MDQEKIRRVGLAMLRNLSGKAENDEARTKPAWRFSHALSQAMIHAGFWKVVQQFSVKRWGDEDIPSDVTGWGF